MRRTRSIAERFEAKIDRTPGYGPGGECWRWTGYVGPNGYGGIGRGRRGEGMERAHRVAFEIANGRLPPDGMEVCHRCDMRDCVNPRHLFEGTRAENLADMTAKGRRRSNPRKGELNPNAKLNPVKVVAIRASADPAGKIAERMNVSRALIRAVRARKVWAHVD